MAKKAFITGITGQDGPFLAKLLLEKGYEVYGGVRRASTPNMRNLEFLGIDKDVKLIEIDLIEYSNLYKIITTIKPDEFYNLAAQSFVGSSFELPILTTNINSLGVAYILDIIKTFSPQTKFYQASTSEMFGKIKEPMQNEETPFYPRSPYGVSKVYAHWLTVNYRESYGLFATSGILFNHESELRGPQFVTRKITRHVANVSNGSTEILELGNLNASRDWGYAKEYVEGMYLMLQADKPDTFVLATGKTTSVRDFVESAYKVIGIDIRWDGAALKEKGYDKKSDKLLIQVNPEFYRPAEVDVLLGNASKAKNILGWEPKIGVIELADIMVKNDINLLNR
ncbi:MAG: GDP-mannose 4,6-dehydratase [Candidatus Peregrinibacteria bacterium]|nr:GDP-mannose 4,6-dehydratase [Candidatus Peregrinibacteria bacterium]MDZ4244850.1 GDP-mannose 4,6-dehydratase [Candidatus Gracilibacteria bacterium]